MTETDLVLLEVTQALDYDRTTALLLRVSGFQPHNALGLVDQVLDLPFVFHNLLLLFLKRKKMAHRMSVTGIAVVYIKLHDNIIVISN